MTRKPTADELKPFFNQLHQLESAVLSGARRLQDVKPALQEIIEGKLAVDEVPLTPPSRYLERLIARARKRDWPFDMRHWRALSVLDNIDHDGILRPISVEIWLGDLQTTYEELWLWVVEEVTKLDGRYDSWRWDEVHHGQKLSGPEHLRFLPGAETVGVPKVTPIGLNLTTHSYRTHSVRPADVRTPEASAGLELFTLIALNPQIVLGMGDDLSQLWVPSLQVTIPGEDLWTDMPLLHWSSVNRRVSLDSQWDGTRDMDSVIPERRLLHAV